GKFLLQGFDNSQCVPSTVEKVRIAEGDVLRSGRHLLAEVGEHDFAIHYAEHTLVDGDDGAMTAQMFASPARFGVARDAVLAGRKNDVCIFRKGRKSLPIGRNE